MLLRQSNVQTTPTRLLFLVPKCDSSDPVGTRDGPFDLGTVRYGLYNVYPVPPPPPRNFDMKLAMFIRMPKRFAIMNVFRAPGSHADELHFTIVPKRVSGPVRSTGKFGDCSTV